MPRTANYLAVEFAFIAAGIATISDVQKRAGLAECSAVASLRCLAAPGAVKIADAIWERWVDAGGCQCCQ